VKAGENNPRNDRLPISIAGTALTAFALLYLTADRQDNVPLIPILGAMLLLTCLTSWRLPSSNWYGYGMRVVLFGSILLIIRLPHEDANYWYFKREYTNLAGCLLAAEMVVQAWRWRDWSQPAEAAGVAVLLSALIVAAASNTFRHRTVGHLVPLYAAMLIFALRQFGAATKPKRKASLLALRALVTIAALAIGYASVESVYAYEYPLTRFAMKLFNRPDLRAEVGLSDTPYLSAVYNPKQSLERVAVIDGRLFDPHLRAIAFDHYENHVWQPSLRLRDFQLIAARELRPNAAGSRCTITTLADTFGVLLTDLDDAGVDADVAIGRDDQAVLQTHDSEETLVYDLINPPNAAFQGPICLAPTASARRTLLDIPPDLDPGVVQLARQVAGTGKPLARVQRIADYLRQHNGYSLAFVPVGDPISDFVLNHRSAHCEYFASAAVLMSRAIGVPARFVTGYFAHEREAGETVVRGRDAHAWAEVWIDGTGWVTMDATPSDGTPDALYGKPSFWTRFYDAISDLPRRIRQWFSQIDRQTVLVLALAAALLAAVITLIRSLLARLRLRGPASRKYADVPPDLQAAARRFERALRRRGLVLHPSRTWRESISAAPQPYQKFISLYDTLRFGGNGDARQLQELLIQIEKESRNSRT
jgi:Transglutaminase-like superfamily